MLAGVGQVTLAADGPASAYAGANFLIPTAAATNADSSSTSSAAGVVAARTLQEMNPLVRVVALAGGEAAFDAAAEKATTSADPTAEGEDDPIAAHDLVVWCGPATAMARAARADAACRARGKLFMAAAVSGHAGYCFCDFGAQYTYRPKENEAGGGRAGGGGAGNDGATAAKKDAAAAPSPKQQQQPPAEQTVAFSTLADALAAPLGGLHVNAHPLFPVLCAAAAVEKEQQQGHQGPPTAAAVERALREGALGSSPGGAELLSATIDLARAYVGQAEVGSDGSGSINDGGQVSAAMREYAPAAATVGAVAANAALRAVSRSGAPLRNVFFYSCADGRGLVEDQPALADGLAGAANGGGGGGKQQKKADQQQAADEAVVLD